jgi:hypothetical protein
MMSDKFASYLKREHGRLETELQAVLSSRFPDEADCARLKKLKLALKDQIREIEQQTMVQKAVMA